jgi:hypothetical protein
MSWRDRLDDELDAQPDGTVRVSTDRAEAEIEVRRADAIGVRIGRVRLERDVPRDVVDEATRLGGALRSIPDRLAPVEVDRALGGAVLRSRPEDMRDREFYEVEVREREVEVRKHRIGDDGLREDTDWDVTREQLGRLLGELDG